MEKPVSSKTRSLKSPGKSFESIIKSLKTKYSGANQQVEKSQGKYRIASIVEKKKVPIIIIPANKQAGNISIGNAELFLSKGEYN